MALAKLYEDAGRYDDAEAQLQKAKEVEAERPGGLHARWPAYYNRQGDFPKTIDALEKAAELEPNNPEGYHRIATYYWDKARKDFRLSAAEKKDYILKGLAMEDKALGLNPDYMEAMTYKNILLRLQANTEKDPTEARRTAAQARPTSSATRCLDAAEAARPTGPSRVKGQSCGARQNVATRQATNEAARKGRPAGAAF